jgi:hypothetical protein
MGKNNFWKEKIWLQKVFENQDLQEAGQKTGSVFSV